MDTQEQIPAPEHGDELFQRCAFSSRWVPHRPSNEWPAPQAKLFLRCQASRPGKLAGYII